MKNNASMLKKILISASYMWLSYWTLMAYLGNIYKYPGTDFIVANLDSIAVCKILIVLNMICVIGVGTIIRKQKVALAYLVILLALNAYRMSAIVSVLNQVKDGIILGV